MNPARSPAPCLCSSCYTTQAISFMLADMAAGIEASWLLYLKSAYEIDQARLCCVLACLCCVLAC